MIFPELLAERDAANKVKRKTKILVIIGNPPYNGYAGIAVEEERSLSTAYSTVKRVPKPQGQGRNDLYVRFFRMAERRIVDGAEGKGIVCFISNYSWLDGLSFTGMRERYTEEFDDIYIDSCNGDKYRTGKLTPDGKPDPSVFSTAYNREGIQVGVAIATLVRRSSHLVGSVHIHFREFWGKDKLVQIGLACQGTGPAYQTIAPPVEIGLPFSPASASVTYLSWLKLPELFPESFPGVKTSRDEVLVDIDRTRLEERIESYFDKSVSHEQMRKIAPPCVPQ
ncbi:MAG: Adenine specific methyltransferase [Chthonomonadaceae bacterium]|nr:Adenine specific methyltransferase [Chthonomonadaceae bacterium]